MEGIGEAIRLHRDRYHVAEMIYVAEVQRVRKPGPDPVRAQAPISIANTTGGSPVTRQLRGQTECGGPGPIQSCLAPVPEREGGLHTRQLPHIQKLYATAPR